MEPPLKSKVYEIVESRIHDHPLGRLIAGILVLLILINVLAAVLETDTPMYQAYGALFNVLAAVSVIIFTVEYLVRIWCCTENPLYRDPVRGRLKYMVTPVALIDLLCVIPFFVAAFLPLTPAAVQFIRFLRIFWILKMNHYSRSLKTFGRVFLAKRGEIFMGFFIMMVLLILGSAMIYFTEHDAQPQKFSSVIASLWWGIETMATIGYGDMVPITPMGKFIAGVVALVGVGLFALPAGIFASGFVEEIHRKKESDTPPQVCPHCGKQIDTPQGSEKK